MTSIPTGISRTSDSLRWHFQTETLGRWSVEQLRLQEQISTGRKLSVPSEDPVGGRLALALQRSLEESEQFLSNIQRGQGILRDTDVALGDAADFVRQAQGLAEQEISSPSNASTRRSAAMVVNSLIDSLLAVVNRQHAGRFLFGGVTEGGGTESAPFRMLGPGILYRGGTVAASISLGADQTRTVSLTGAEAFGALEAVVDNHLDLDPRLTLDTPLSAFNGGEGVELGTIVVSDGTNTTSVDLTGAEDLADVIGLMEASLPATTSVSLDSTANALRIESSLPGANIEVRDLPGGSTARQLGILTPEGGCGSGVFVGTDLDPVLTPLTRLEDIAGGSWDRTSGFIITNGPYSATVDLSDCQTVEDLINRINSSGVYVEARIAPEGDRLQVVSLLSGPGLSIGENGGTTAADLGLRTLGEATPLEVLNRGGGVDIVEGTPDLLIHLSDGTDVEVDLAGCRTVGDVVERISASAPGRLVCRLAAVGNGIEVEDLTGGTGTFSIESAPGGRTTAADLGLWRSAPVGQHTITGDDVNPIVAENLFTHLLELRDALLGDDVGGITRAAQRLSADADHLIAKRGQVGVRLDGLDVDQAWNEHQRLMDQELLSLTRDLDYSVALAQFAAVNTLMEATLRTAANVGRLSLLDYL